MSTLRQQRKANMESVTVRYPGVDIPTSGDILIQILHALGRPAKSATWRLEAVEATGAGAEYVHRLSDEKILVDGEKFIEFLSGLHQIIDGSFTAFDDNNKIFIIEVLDGVEFSIYFSDSKYSTILPGALPGVTAQPPDDL